MPPLIKKPPPEELSNIQVPSGLYPFIPSQTGRQMRRFREMIVEEMIKMKIPTDLYADEQDPALWKRYSELICERRPFLLDYEDAWPLQLCFDTRVRRHRNRIGLDPAPCRNDREARAKVHRLPPSLDQLRSSSPNNATVLPSGRYSPYPSPSFNGEPSTSRHEIRYSPQASARPFPGTSKLDLSPSSSPTVYASPQGSHVSCASSQATAVSPSQSSQSHEHRADGVFVGCNECDHHLPTHLAGQNDAIKSLLCGQKANIEECIRVLCRGGMSSDTHLRVFARWPLACRKAFVDDLGADKCVMKMLGKLTYRSIPIGDDVSIVDDDLAARVIRQPLEEEWLSDPTTPLEFLLKALGLPTNRGPFQDMVTIEGALRRWFSGMQISRKSSQLFERYENQWPARFILRRLARELRVKPQDDHLYPTPSPYASQSDTFGKPPMQPFTYARPHILKIMYTCPIHPGPDQDFVASGVRRCLQSKGLTDLIPVFALMGASTEEIFRDFCALSVVERDKAVVDAGVKVNSFQSLALKLELWEGVLDYAT